MTAIHRSFILRDDAAANSLWSFLKHNWRALAGDGKPLAVTVEQHKAKRNNAQNARYWAMLHDIAASAWVNGRQYDADCWHHFFRSLYLPRVETPSGELIPASTTSLNTSEFADYMTRIEAYATSELGIPLL